MHFGLILLIILNLTASKSFAESIYSIDQFQSKLFNSTDKKLMQHYFSDDYLIKKREEDLASNGKKFFHFLSISMAQEIREERKKNPFGDIPWPDSFDLIDVYAIDLEKESI